MGIHTSSSKVCIYSRNSSKIAPGLRAERDSAIVHISEERSSIPDSFDFSGRCHMKRVT